MRTLKDPGENGSSLYPLATLGSVVAIYDLKSPDWVRLGLKDLSEDDRRELTRRIKAQPTGEFREPQPGEWFLSGAIVHAYRHNGPEPLSTKYHIARLVLTRTVTQTVLV